MLMAGQLEQTYLQLHIFDLEKNLNKFDLGTAITRLSINQLSMVISQPNCANG